MYAKWLLTMIFQNDKFVFILFSSFSIFFVKIDDVSIVISDRHIYWRIVFSYFFLTINKYNDREFIIRRARVYFRIEYMCAVCLLLIRLGGYFRELTRLKFRFRVS